MGNLIARRWRPGGILIGLAFVALPISSAAAEITLGPLAASHGFKVTISAGCNGPRDYASVSVAKSGRHYRLGYNYDDDQRNATKCTASSKLRSATLTLKWGKLVHGRLKFGHAGRLKKTSEIYGDAGCTSTGHQRKVRGTGSLTIAIHRKAFGKLVIHKASAELQRFGPPEHCGGGSANVVSLIAGWDNFERNVEASAYSGQHFVYVLAPDNPGPHVGGGLDDEFFGTGSQFSFSSNLGSAQVGASNPFLTGSLKYEATTACSADSAGHSHGTLSGELVLHDPAVGTRRFSGPSAEEPQMSRANGSCT